MIASAHLHGLLLENPLFAGLTLKESDKAALQSLGFIPKRFQARTELTRELDTGGHRTLIIHSGWTCVQRFMADGERQIIDFPIAGDILGLGHGGHAPPLPVTAVTEVVIFESTSMVGAGGATLTPTLSQIFMGAFGRREAIAGERLTSLGRRSALARTAHLLLELGARQSLSNGRIEDFECPLTQYDLADALGLTPIHVNRMLRELREDSLLSFRQGEVEFLDLPGLIGLADFDDGYLSRR
ncbi:Crp/Fnr family transcriptional regulator [Mesorhizobium sp. CAU 1732]|jgi:CRP-like cAMP-binding protein|uniref:Crp/Fnr family transcriptional regulator n=1 Tax=Mesorhizobium sp. CAU 1732 TaxID=3140358 RepID=UPI003261A9CD